MKFAIAGAGAVGAYMAALMARAGQEVTLLARGRQLEAIRARGVRVTGASGEFTAHPAVTGDPACLADAGVVFLAVKAHSLPQLAPHLGAPVVVTLQNGIPWWFAPNLASVDPGGVLAAAVAPERIVGGIVYFATEVVEPGVVRHVEGSRVSLGEPAGGRSERCREISAALTAGGLRSPVAQNIRQEIWVKLLGNLAFNPISALTRATLAGMARDPHVRALVTEIMREAVRLGEALGIEVPISIEQRIAGAEKVGEHKTSMLQDLEAGRRLELEAIAGAVLELAARYSVAMPHTRAVYACTKLLENQYWPQMNADERR